MRLLLVFLAACNAMASPSDLADKVQAARERMHRRFEASQRMQHAISLGQLDRARLEADLVNSLEEPDALPAWRAAIDGIRAAAREVAATKDTMAAAKASARLGQQCARCHEAGKARIVFAKTTPPKASQMTSHAWAAARMWEGLIGPDAERWSLGARQLAEAKVTLSAEDGSLGIADDVSRMKLLARRALDPKTQRDVVYGELLATCAHCHFVIRD